MANPVSMSFRCCVHHSHGEDHQMHSMQQPGMLCNANEMAHLGGQLAHVGGIKRVP